MSPTHNHPKKINRWREEPESSSPAIDLSTDPRSRRSCKARRLKASWLSFLISLFAHTAVLILLAFIVIQGLPERENIFSLQASMQPQNEKVDGARLMSVVVSAPAFDAQAHDAQKTVVQEAKETLSGNTTSRENPKEFGEIPAPLERFEPRTENTADASFRLQQTVAALASLSTNAESESTDAESGKPGEATFFGARAYGNRFVFIIDASTSMEGYRWNRALGELLKSIGRLAEGTEFFIIAFHFEPVPIDFSRASTKSYLVKGNGSVVQCRRWLRSLTLAPQTMPASSLELAMAFQPDAIFLLSDGELRDNSLALLRLANQKDGNPIIPINTIHLFSDDGKETLETLAKENGGSFTAVGAKD